MKKDILLLGDPLLYQKSADLLESELPAVPSLMTDLHDTLMAFRKDHGAGRAIAAPQIGVFKRVIYQYIDRPAVFINPMIVPDGGERMEVWDDCMSFPHLLVRVKRFRRCTVRYRDARWNPCELRLEGDLSELLQHEYDHLDGILATLRAIDSKAFQYKP